MQSIIHTAPLQIFFCGARWGKFSLQAIFFSEESESPAEAMPRAAPPLYLADFLVFPCLFPGFHLRCLFFSPTGNES
ncbi:MAG: hypothetical protein V1782_13845, partial [Pseudomonadota bacterium]